jgi:type III secretory pathway component EscS
MTLIGSEVVEQFGRPLLLAIVPTLIIPVASLMFSLLQGMMAVRDGSMQYAVRVVALVGVVALFGFSVSASFVELMRLALR